MSSSVEERDYGRRRGHARSVEGGSTTRGNDTSGLGRHARCGLAWRVEARKKCAAVNDEKACLASGVAAASGSAPVALGEDEAA